MATSIFRCRQTFQLKFPVSETSDALLFVAVTMPEALLGTAEKHSVAIEVSTQPRKGSFPLLLSHSFDMNPP